MFVAWRVLLADDDPGVRNLLRTYVELVPGVEVSEAQNGEDAKDLLDRIRFDLVISDVEMPRADGFEVLRHARACASNASTPFFMVTSHDTDVMVDAAFAQGATEFLPKPVERKAFVELVKRTLGAG